MDSSWPGYSHSGNPNPVPFPTVDALLRMPNSPAPVVERVFRPRGGELTGVGADAVGELRMLACRDTFNSFREVWEGIAQNPHFANREYIVHYDNSSPETFDPTNPATAAHRTALTYAQTNDRVVRIANALVYRFGVKKGDRVGIAARNYADEWLPAWWAALCVGAICVPINAWLTAPELSWCIRDAGVKVLFLDSERLARLVDSGPSTNEGGAQFDSEWTHLGETCVRHAVVIKSHLGSLLSDRVQRAKHKQRAHDFGDILRWYDGDAASGLQLPPVSIHPEDPAKILYSSGTTGRPKGVLSSHRNWMQNLANGKYTAARWLLRRGAPVPRPAPNGATATKGAVWFIPVPLFHLTGIGHQASAAVGGGTCVFVHKWDVGLAAEVVGREKITNWISVPTQVLQLLDHIRQHPSVDLSTLTAVNYGGAPSPASIRGAVVNAFARRGVKVEPSNLYGSTETLRVGHNVNVDYVRKPESLGPTTPVIKVKIVDSSGNAMPPDSVGDIWVRSPMVALGYWNNPAATRANFQDGWYNTGDVGKVDSEGFLYLLDRSKDMLIRGGENIYCNEVESALYTHPSVLEACVIGVPHPILGEECAACVILKPCSPNVTSSDLRAHVRSRIASFKVPEYIRFVDAIPWNASGKQVKRQVKQEFVEWMEKNRIGKASAKI
ncbi:acetyl-CoA synthetase-like protein [Gonapodya prolifera JEL478]|uniref:Acetyl-CoA synthetase-like protein n=1 Tax=Gonapodya prolifera (strain JEL478) TaxID=1344416 RepID=A0A139AVP8_GONPJ|nr:acetyl-CoA synthetase-like protein [Gonapodya prolifera JEL478]|eukprot:KXS20779.1 acetyl-CoA synthetase-like protein [Gonapodya prolifera JEL478]